MTREARSRPRAVHAMVALLVAAAMLVPSAARPRVGERRGRRLRDARLDRGPGRQGARWSRERLVRCPDGPTGERRSGYGRGPRPGRDRPRVPRPGKRGGSGPQDRRRVRLGAGRVPAGHGGPGAGRPLRRARCLPGGQPPHRVVEPLRRRHQPAVPYRSREQRQPEPPYGIRAPRERLTALGLGSARVAVLETDRQCRRPMLRTVRGRDRRLLPEALRGALPPAQARRAAADHAGQHDHGTGSSKRAANDLADIIWSVSQGVGPSPTSGRSGCP